MTQELLRDSSLPYFEFFMRPGDKLDYAFEWANWLASRWLPSYGFAINATIRPRKSTGYQYTVTTPGLSGNVEPTWPTTLGATVTDGSVVWTCEAVDTQSLATTISTALWSADSPLTIASSILTGTNSTAYVNVPSNASDGDYYVRNDITLANGLTKEGVLLIKVRAKQI